MTYTYTQTIKPSDVYPYIRSQAQLDVILSVNRVRVVAFRPPRPGDNFISQFTKAPALTDILHATADWVSSAPRLIVEPVESGSIWA